MDIKPIETRYKGYRFRSRLEARWAVFFDALGIEWEYEPEGFNLGKHGYYLPDFRINSYVYVEIKPKVFREQSVGHDKCVALSDKLGTIVILVGGTPGDGHDVIVCRNGKTEFMGTWSIGTIPGIGSCLAVFDKYSGQNMQFEWIAIPSRYSVTDAMNTARSARFEHGEMPNVHHSLREYCIINPITGDGLSYQSDDGNPPEWVIRLVESGYEIWNDTLGNARNFIEQAKRRHELEKPKGTPNA